MNNPGKLADRLLRRYRLSTPTLENVLFIAQDLGYELVEFEPGSSGSEALFAELKLDERITGQGAFLYTNHRMKLLFLRETLEEDEKRYAAAHELGHIVCGHVHPEPSVREEAEANEFAHYFLHPSLPRRMAGTAQHRKGLILGIIAAALVLAAGGIYGANRYVNDRYSQYYATKSGKKYHLPDCATIRGKPGLHRLTKEEMASGDYQPCGVCLGEEREP